MRRLTWSINVTLDGCCDHQHVVADDEFHHFMARRLGEFDGLVFGGVSYRLLAGHWPRISKSGDASLATLELARRLDAKTKYVFSRNVDALSWANSVLLDGDLEEEVRELKDHNGGDLVLLGSPGLGLTLTRLGLIDTFEFAVQPIIAGSGRRLLDAVGAVQRLELSNESALKSGVRVLRYEVRATPAAASTAHAR